MCVVLLLIVSIIFFLYVSFCIQHHIESELGLKTQIKLRAQVWAGKWKHAMQWTKAFPVLIPYDFKEYNTPKFDNSHAFQKKWIDTLIDNGKLNITNITNPRMLTDGNTILDRSTMDDLLNLLNQTWHLDWPTVPDSGDNNNNNSTIHTPHVYSEQMTSDYCLDTIYHNLREFFQLDEKTNCKLIPEVNETVLHLRNFIAEMPRRGKGLGFEELDPIRAASELFANHQSGDKVAIISRMDNNIDKYKEALEMKGLKVRYIQGQTGNEDFCFLIKAKKEIIGQTRSTFGYWASILGNMKHARLYSVDTPNTRRRDVHYYSYNFTNLQLKNRIIYENYS